MILGVDVAFDGAVAVAVRGVDDAVADAGVALRVVDDPGVAVDATPPSAVALCTSAATTVAAATLTVGDAPVAVLATVDATLETALPTRVATTLTVGAARRVSVALPPHSASTCRFNETLCYVA
ncbi:MAG: hypothetical protein LC793_24705 [Thermomicrobia bacterium]|nr:hypothetical protein [Thermomicrobia bacterium]